MKTDYTDTGHKANLNKIEINCIIQTTFSNSNAINLELS